MKRTSTSTQQKPTMKTKTSVKAGGHNLNHNETIKGVVMKTRVKAGERSEKLSANHNETPSEPGNRTGTKAGENKGEAR